MSRNTIRTGRGRPPILVVLAGLIVLAGCATLSGLAALREVAFDLDRVSEVRIAGINVENKRSWSDLSAYDVARLGVAVLAKDVPLEAVVHVRGENPQSNEVDARLTEMEWELFLEDRKTLEGRLDQDYVFPPGTPVDIPIRVRTDLADVFSDGSANDLFNLALALADQGGEPVEVRLDARPTIETSLGRIRYPSTITLRKMVGGTAGAPGGSR